MGLGELRRCYCAGILGNFQLEDYSLLQVSRDTRRRMVEGVHSSFQPRYEVVEENRGVGKLIALGEFIEHHGVTEAAPTSRNLREESLSNRNGSSQPSEQYSNSELMVEIFPNGSGGKRQVRKA